MARQGMKSTLSGGREYSGQTDSPTPGTSLHICEQDVYHANSGGNIENDGYAPKIPFIQSYDPYNQHSRMDGEEGPVRTK